MTCRALVSVALVLALLLPGCARGPTSEGAVPRATGSPTAGDAREAVLGLCEILAEHAGDAGAAEAVFLDRSHETLHQIAAAVEPIDRSAAGVLLGAKQRVEADLAADPLPPGFPEDVEALLAATRAALAELGLPAPACPD